MRSRGGFRLFAREAENDNNSKGKSMIIPGGPFQRKNAELITDCDGVIIEGKTIFFAKDGRTIFQIGEDERDLRHVYDLLRRKRKT